MIIKRLNSFVICVLASLTFSPILAQDKGTVNSKDVNWMEIAPNEMWISINPNTKSNSIAIKLKSEEELKINEDNSLIFKDAYKITQFSPIGVFESKYVNPEKKIYEIEAIYSGNLNFLKESDITQIILNTSTKKFSFDISKKRAQTLRKLCSNASYISLFTSDSEVKDEPQSRLVTSIIEKNTNKINTKTPQLFIIEFYRKRRGESTVTLEGKEKVEVSLIQLENIVNEWKSYTDNHYIYDCKITKEE